MGRSVRRRMRGIVVLASMLICWGGCAQSASAQLIEGDPLQIYMDGSGHLQVLLQGYGTGELVPANQQLSQWSGMTFILNDAYPCGPDGNQVSPVSGPTAVSGSGTAASPYTMSAVYDCAWSPEWIRITQTFTYVNGDDFLTTSYTITNMGTGEAKFRAVAEAYLDEGGSEQGQGFYDGAGAESPQDVGALNDAEGTKGGFLEVAGTPWTSYMEDSQQAFGMDPFSGLLGTVNPALAANPEVAVQIDKYTSFGLDPNETDTLVVDWFFDTYDGLSLVPAANSMPVGSLQSVVATVRRHGQPVAGAVVRYTVTGANPQVGSVTTSSSGTATISWLCQKRGGDSLAAYTDANGSGTFDPAIDTQQTVQVMCTQPLSAETIAASGITQNSAVLNASVWAGSDRTAAQFQYGTDPTLANSRTTPLQLAPAGAGAIAVSTAVTALKPGTRYYFRVEATDPGSATPAFGSILRFTTEWPLQRITSPILWSFPLYRGYATVAKLLLLHVPVGSLVTASCDGKGCPNRTTMLVRDPRSACVGAGCDRTGAPGAVNVNLASPFRAHRLAYADKLIIRIVKRHFVGQVYVFDIGKVIQPRIMCLAPGATVPGRGC